ncbi:MAG: IclR family transcriptional regulator [Sulfitobacter sp.]
MAEDGSDTPKQAQIPTSLRLFAVLEAIGQRGVAIRPADLTEALGLPKPTVHRLLQTAEAEGILQRDIDGRSYGPGPRLRKLAVNTLSSEHLRTARLTILKSVAEAVGETCNLATADREGMTYLERVETHWPLRIQLPIGTQVPFHCTASGKLYLSSLRARTLDGVLSAHPLTAHTPRSLTEPDALRAALRDTRAQGYSTDEEEFMEGMVAVAVPILDGQDRLIATLSAHAPVQRRSLADLVAHLDILHSGAAKLSALMDA